ncbi:hypothetical protein ACTWPB_23310 [Nocardia sp. IBHARD005]|uniref:hypothetical protein n=1 Tax=Nocardia sp. IBHARD005 TaxID=3457765 RepID=UPI0040594D14
MRRYALHFAPAPPGIELPAEHAGALVMVDDVAARHAEYTDRLAHWKSELDTVELTAEERAAL